MKLKKGMRALSVLLTLLLVSVFIVPAVTVVFEVQVQRPIPEICEGLILTLSYKTPMVPFSSYKKR